MTKTLYALLAALAAATVAGCSGIPRRDPGAALDAYLPFAGPPVGEVRLLQYPWSWEVVGRYQIVLWTTPWDATLVTVNGPCIELPFANRIAVTSTVGLITTFDALLVRGDRCPILELRPIDTKALKAHQKAMRGVAAAKGPASAI